VSATITPVNLPITGERTVPGVPAENYWISSAFTVF